MHLLRKETAWKPAWNGNGRTDLNMGADRMSAFHSIHPKPTLWPFNSLLRFHLYLASWKICQKICKSLPNMRQLMPYIGDGLKHQPAASIIPRHILFKENSSFPLSGLELQIFPGFPSHTLFVEHSGPMCMRTNMELFWIVGDYAWKMASTKIDQCRELSTLCHGVSCNTGSHIEGR